MPVEDQDFNRVTRHMEDVIDEQKGRIKELEAKIAALEAQAPTQLLKELKAAILVLPRANYKSGFRSEYHVYLPSVVKLITDRENKLLKEQEEAEP